MAARQRRLGAFALTCVVAVPLIFIGPGLWLLWQREHGTHVQATVTGCRTSSSGRSYAEYCTASWTAHGRVIVGDIEGTDGSHVGDTIGATARGDTAYSTSLTLPLLLIGLGVPFVGLGVRMWIVGSRPKDLQAELMQQAPPAGAT
jgi:hypothetical protein